MDKQERALINNGRALEALSERLPDATPDQLLAVSNELVIVAEAMRRLKDTGAVADVRFLVWPYGQVLPIIMNQQGENEGEG